MMFESSQSNKSAYAFKQSQIKKGVQFIFLLKNGQMKHFTTFKWTISHHFNNSTNVLLQIKSNDFRL